MSRATYDSAGGRYHIRNVVSVAEGLDRRERRRVHQRRRPAEPGDRDRGGAAGSATRPTRGGPRSPRSSTCRSTRRADSSAPTRARPDSTLGWVTPLLAYPLGVPMSDAAKRSAPRSGGRTARGRGAGSDDGHHAPVGGRRGAGRSARWWTRSCPTAIGTTCKGPFLMLSETPTNNAVELPDRRRRLPPAGDLRLHRPSAGRSAGSSPRSRRCCHRASRRLVLRNVHVRGKRYDVVVDSAGRTRSCRTADGRPPVIALVWPSCCCRRPQAAGAGLPRAGRGRHRRVSGLPDALLSRLERQHRPDLPRAARRAGGESAGPTPPTRVSASPSAMPRESRRGSTWAADSAAAGDSGAACGPLEYRLAATSPRRDARVVPARHDAGRARLPVRQAPSAAIHARRRSTWRRSRCWWPTSPGCRRTSGARQLELLGAASVGDAPLAASAATVAGACSAASCGVRVERPSLDGRSRLALELRVDPRRGHACGEPAGPCPSQLPARAPFVLTVRITTDARAAHAARARLDLQSARSSNSSARAQPPTRRRPRRAGSSARCGASSS